MKLKKLLATLSASTAAVAALTLMSVTASADAVNVPDGTETVLKTFSIGEGSENMTAWSSNCWVQLYGIDQSYFTDDNYVKIAFSLSTAPVLTDDGSKMSTVAGWGWSNYSGWLCAGKFGQGTVTAGEQNLVPATNSQDALFYFYLPTSDFTPGEYIAGNIYSGYDGATIESIELVEVSSYQAPALPEYEYVFDEASGSVDAGTWGQPAKTPVGDDQTITAKVLGGDFIIKVPFTGDSRPKVTLSDGSGDGGTLNWIQIDPEGVADGVAYYTKADISAAWTAAGGKADFSDLTMIHIAAQADALTVENVALYSTVETVEEPPAPTTPAVKATPGDGKVILKWSAVEGATKYKVNYRLNGANAWTTDETTDTTYTVTGLTNGSKYNFFVIATNGIVWSQWTSADIVSATPVEIVKVAVPSFSVKGVFGGREVTFNCTTPGAKVYYTTEGRSTLKLTDPCVEAGETVLFKAYYGTMYARAYCDGKWSNPAKLILKIPTVNTPTITKLTNGKYKIKTTTPGTIVYYTIDGTTPSATNYKGKFWTSRDVFIPAGKTVKAIAVRSCFSDSAVATAKT